MRSFTEGPPEVEENRDRRTDDGDYRVDGTLTAHRWTDTLQAYNGHGTNLCRERSLYTLPLLEWRCRIERSRAYERLSLRSTIQINLAHLYNWVLEACRAKCLRDLR